MRVLCLMFFSFAVLPIPVFAQTACNPEVQRCR